MLKVELHTHTSDDPVDPIPYSTPELIQRAADFGYGALAITLHDHQLDIRRFESFARERGVVLIPGVERTVEGKHVLLLNFRRGTDQVTTFGDLARLRRREPGLVVAPHPYFPSSCALGSRLDQHADLFDAVERNAMYFRGVDFNRHAERWAAVHGKPIVGNGDVHRLAQLGSTYSLVDVERDADSDAICSAIAAGRVKVESRALGRIEALRILASLFRSGQRTAPSLDIEADWVAAPTSASTSIAG